jgi:hydrogenase nickel incorporation protein HypA/HybF
MHELALSQNILEAVKPHVGPGRRLTKVVVDCDVCLGIVETSLDYCFTITARHMGFEGAVLEVHMSEAEAACPACSSTTTVASLFETCPRCGYAPLTIRGTRELRIAHIEVEEE